MAFRVQEWSNGTASLLSEVGQELARFASIEDALDCFSELADGFDLHYEDAEADTGDSTPCSAALSV